MAITLTVWPDQGRIHLAVQMTNTAITKINVGRRGPDGFSQLIRYGNNITSPGGHAELDDFEVPLDTPVQYIATQAIPVGSEVQTSAVAILPSNGGSWLKDPGFPSMNIKLNVITSIETLTRASRAGVFNVLDRPNPIVVTAKRQGPAGTLVLHTFTDAERISLMDLLARGTVLLLQTPPAYGFGSRYVYFGDAEEARVGVAQEQIRRWTLPFVVVDRPEGLDHQDAVVKTWQAVKDIYPTWQDLANSGKTWRGLLEEGP